LIHSQALVNDGVEFGLLKRLGQIIMSAQADGLDNFAGITDAGEHDDFHAGTHFTQLFQSLQAVNARHQNVKQYQVGLKAFLHALQGFFSGGSGFDFVVIHFEQRFDVTLHAGFVIDQQDVGRVAHLVFPLLGLEAGLSGTIKENLQPAPTSLSTQIFPPMPPIRRRAIARPSPMPSLSSVCGSRKKSSNTSMRYSAAIPGPVSETLTFTEFVIRSSRRR